MIRRGIKWILLFDSVDELDQLFNIRDTAPYKNILGSFMFVKTAEAYLAFENKCPHQNKPLDGCWIEENRIVCPMHRYAFDLTNGRGHGMALKQYPIKIVDNQVYFGKETWLFGRTQKD